MVLNIEGHYVDIDNLSYYLHIVVDGIVVSVDVVVVEEYLDLVR